MGGGFFEGLFGALKEATVGSVSPFRMAKYSTELTLELADNNLTIDDLLDYTQKPVDFEQDFPRAYGLWVEVDNYRQEVEFDVGTFVGFGRYAATHPIKKSKMLDVYEQVFQEGAFNKEVDDLLRQINPQRDDYDDDRRFGIFFDVVQNYCNLETYRTQQQETLDTLRAHANKLKQKP